MIGKQRKLEKREQKKYFMSSECEVPVNCCIIHIAGKGSVQKMLKNETLKNTSKKGEWLELPGECNTTRTIAATSLKFRQCSHCWWSSRRYPLSCKLLLQFYRHHKIAKGYEQCKKPSVKNCWIKPSVLMKYGLAMYMMAHKESVSIGPEGCWMLGSHQMFFRHSASSV